MDRETIIKLADEANIWIASGWEKHGTTIDELIRFAKIVTSAEREACAKVCDDIDTEYNGEDVLATWCAQAIRARGEQ